MFITQRYTLHHATIYLGELTGHNVKYVKINWSRQLAYDGVVDTVMDYTSNDAGSCPAYYLLFSSVFFLLLFTTLSYKTAIMYFE